MKKRAMPLMKYVLKTTVKSLLKPLSDRWVYTARSGLAKGMRLKGGVLLPAKAHS
ncbi:MAG: hypothetical protein RMK45_07100 [Armatimonadota bacterium]|nr:hypothetical protein [Armatimonadota bacterium]